MLWKLAALGILLPAGVAGVLALAALLPRFAGRGAAATWGAAALAVGFLAGFAACFGWPPFPAGEAWQWVFWAVAAAALWEALPVPGPAVRLAGLLILATAFGWQTLVRLTPRYWEPALLWPGALGIGALIVVGAACLGSAQGAGQPRTFPLLRALHAGAAAGLYALLGSARLGQAAGCLAAACSSLMLLSWWRPQAGLWARAPAIYSMALAGLGVNLYFYGDEVALAPLLLAAAPPLLETLIARLDRKRAVWPALLAVLLPMAAALALAWTARSRADTGYYESMIDPSRREVLAGAAALPLLWSLSRDQDDPLRPAETAPAPLPRRHLGATGRALPILGLGCYPAGALAGEEEAVAVIRGAYEGGARYFDTAPSYSDGQSERRVGAALKDCPREELFIATKTLERDGDAALAELEASLERLGTGYADSVQVHELRSLSDLDAVLAPGGVVQALEDARRRKKIRHLGVTGHRDPRFLLEAIERYPFATALVPVNPLDCHHLSFTRAFVPKAKEKGVAVIAMKVYAGGALPRAKPELATGELLRFALAQSGVCVAVPGVDSTARWAEARAAALAPAPGPEEQERLIAAAGPHRGRQSEWYKNEA